MAPDMFPAVRAAAGGNIILSLHNYGRRVIPSQMTDYINNVYAMECPLVIGKFGYSVTEGKASSAGVWDVNYLAAQVSMDTYSTRGVGLTMWIGSGGTDELALKAGNASFLKGGAAANLAEVGPRLWAMGHGNPGNKTYTWNWFINPPVC